MKKSHIHGECGIGGERKHLRAKAQNGVWEYRRKKEEAI
jgi:hypothetical protein